MKRFHLRVSVDNLNDGIRFDTALFGATPSAVKPDYAKWMRKDPRVNFAMSRRGGGTGINHLGMQVESTGELHAMQSRLTALQTPFETEQGAASCYAKSDKYWVTDPSGMAWETVHTLESIPVFGQANRTESMHAGCCTPKVDLRMSAFATGACSVSPGLEKQGIYEERSKMGETLT